MGNPPRKPGTPGPPLAEEHGMSARLTDVTVAYERTEAFRDVVCVSVTAVALLSSLLS